MEVNPIMKYIPVKEIQLHTEVNFCFNDIIGHDNIKAQINTIVESFIEGNATTKGMIFTGSMGTGKTSMAKAIMNKAITSGIPFVSINCKTDLVYWIKVAYLKYGRCIIFHDEADLLWNPELVKYLDGISPYHNNVLLIFATTNHIERAIVRSNRVDKVFNFGLPSYEERLKYIENHQPIMGEHSDMIARATSGLTISDLSVISRELNGDVTDSRIREVLNKIGGISNNETPDARIIEHHSWRVVGQCFLSYILRGGHKPQEINIKQINPLVYPQQFDNFVTRDEVISLLTSVLAGNIFEQHYCGSMSLLAAGDNDILDKINIVLKTNNMLVCRQLQPDSYYSTISRLIKEINQVVANAIRDYDSTIRTLQFELMKLQVLQEKDITKIIGISIIDSVEVRTN